MSRKRVSKPRTTFFQSDGRSLTDLFAQGARGEEATHNPWRVTVQAPRPMHAMELQQVIDESRPMLEEFLSDLGIYRAGQRIADPQLLDAFSDWVAAQTIGEDDFFYLVSRVGAFISEYVIEGTSGVRYIRGKRIMLRFPVGDGAFEEFDPYEVAAVFIRGTGGLKEFLSTLC